MANLGTVTTGGAVITTSDDPSDDITSNIIKIHPRASSMSVHLQAPTNTDLVGVWKVQLSNDGEAWVDATFSDDTTSVDVASATTMNAMRTVALSGSKYARVFYGRTSGSTGTLSATVQVHKS